jgi:serine/threonine protein phosphatase PrpC
MEILTRNEARLFFEQEHLDDATFEAGPGVVTLYSSRSPGKDTPNEDAAAVLATGIDSAVVAVADGLGGAPAGQQASSLAISCLVRSVQEAVTQEREVRWGILNGFEQANEEVLALGLGAATTLTAVEVQGNSLRDYHVGDSFVLVMGQRGKLKLQSIPHSPVGYGVESGLLDETDAMYHEDRHIISNVIGSTDLRIDVGVPIQLAPRDTVLLATDGLSDNLHTTEIVETARKGKLEKLSTELAHRALDRMLSRTDDVPSKPDDLTFAVFRLGNGRGGASTHSRVRRARTRPVAVAASGG